MRCQEPLARLCMRHGWRPRDWGTITFNVSADLPFVRRCGPYPQGLHDPWGGDAAQRPRLSKALAMRKPWWSTSPCRSLNSAKGMLFVTKLVRIPWVCAIPDEGGLW